MRDFTAFVRSHLEQLELPRHRELQIVEELATQLEDTYDALRARGRSDEDQRRFLPRHESWLPVSHQRLLLRIGRLE